MALITTRDIFEVRPQKSIVDLSKTEKFKLMDSFMNPRDESKRGLNVDFGLSASGRRINNRIYTPKGQRAGMKSWTEPYNKPIIRNHDRNEDPLGRITKVDWVSLDQTSMTMFKDVRQYMEVKDALESDNPKRIYAALKKHNLLLDKRWMGTGELIATANILDEQAIEKFLDGRYLTFSAGATTDRWVCSACNSNWSTGDICDHRPGEITDEGELVVMITGNYYGHEASVLNTPAHSFSTVRSLEFADTLEAYNAEDCFLTDTSTIYLSDSMILSPGETMPVQDKKTDTSPETQVDDATQTNTTQVDDTAVKQQLVDDVVAAVLAALDARNATQDDESGQVEDQTDTSDTDTEGQDTGDAGDTQDEDTVEVDWYLLDATLGMEMGDAKLSADERTALDESAFCGPERSFPVPDQAHIDAARRLVERAKLDDRVKAEVLALVDAREEALKATEDSGCAQNCGCAKVADELTSVKADYEQALAQIQSLRDTIEQMGQETNTDDATDTSSTEGATTEDSQPDGTVNLTDTESGTLENPSGSSGESLNGGALAKTSDSFQGLDAYHKNVVTRYLDLRDNASVEAAEAHLTRLRRRGYLLTTFDVSKYIQEND